MIKALLNTNALRWVAPLLLIGLSTGSALAAGDIEAGKAKAATCVGCHGADGKALLPEQPNLAGQNAGYLAKQLHEFQSGERSNAIMAGMSAALSAEDIENISAFYESLPPIEGVASEENLQLGTDIYRGGITGAGIPACSGCHGANGKGNPAAGWPALAGQNAAYTVIQLEAFRSKERANDSNAVMRSIAERLTDAEIQAVSNYIMGLH